MGKHKDIGYIVTFSIQIFYFDSVATCQSVPQILWRNIQKHLFFCGICNLLIPFRRHKNHDKPFQDVTVSRQSTILVQIKKQTRMLLMSFINVFNVLYVNFDNF